MGKAYLTHEDLMKCNYTDSYKMLLIEFFSKTHLVVKMNGGRFESERIFPDGAFVGIRFTDIYSDEKFKMVVSWAAIHLVKIGYHKFIDGDLIRQRNWEDVILLNQGNAL